MRGWFWIRSDLVFRSQVLRAMVRQAAHLQRLMNGPLTGAEKLTGGLGLCFAGLVLPQSPHYLAQGLDLVRKEAGRQILSDGGHISRSPEVLLQVLADLVLLKAALIQARAEVPNSCKSPLTGQPRCCGSCAMVTGNWPCSTAPPQSRKAIWTRSVPRPMPRAGPWALLLLYGIWPGSGAAVFGHHGYGRTCRHARRADPRKLGG